MATAPTLDLSGNTLKVDDIIFGANTPGDAGTTITNEEMAVLDGVTAGTATASKAVVLGASKEIATITTATITNLTTTTLTPTTIAGTPNISGAATVDAAGSLSVTAGGSIKTSVANTVYPVYLNTVQQALSGAGAVALTNYYTAVTTTGANALTLADSTVTGQMKKIQLIVDAGDGTLTFNGTSTIVFADVGDTAELIWNGADWIPIALYNTADGATAPVYTP